MTEFLIRDKRDSGWLWMTKKTIDRIQGSFRESSSHIAVYVQLCYHSNYTTQQCFPSITLIANKLNLSRRHIIRVINALEEIKVIHKEKTEGKKTVYSLLDPDVTGDTTDTGRGSCSVTGDTTDTRNRINISITKESKEKEDLSPKGDPSSSLPKKKTLPTLFCEAYELHFKFKPFLNANGKIAMPMKEIMALERLKRSISEEKVREILTPDTEGRIPVFNDDRIMQDKWVQKRLYFPSVLIDRITEINHAAAMEANNGSSR